MSDNLTWASIEAWIEARRDEYRVDYGDSGAYRALDALLDDFRQHMVTGTPLDRPVHTTEESTMMATVPPAVAEVLASVCGYHAPDPCEHCVGAYAHRRDRWGWSDEQIVADAALYRDHRERWLQQAYDAYTRRQRDSQEAGR